MSRSAVALALLTLLIGAAVGFLFGSTQRDDPDVVTSAAVTTTVAPLASPPEDAASAPSKRTRERPVARGESARPKDAASAETGGGTITGTVTGPDGAPLAGVLVVAEAAADIDQDEDEPPPLPPGSPPARRDIEQEVRKFEAQIRAEESRRREAVTDATGAYALSGLAGEKFGMEAWLAGWRIQKASGKPWAPVAAGSRCDFKATPIHTLTVNVLLPDGQPAQFAQIAWTSSAGGETKNAGWRRNSPEVEVDPGTYDFTATAGPQDATAVERLRMEDDFRFGHMGDEHEPLYRSEPQTVTVAAGVAQTVTIRLTSRPAIRVKVVFAAAEHPEAVRIAAVRLDGGASSDPSRLLDDGDDVESLWLQGTFEGTITGLEPGAYLVGATFRGGMLGPVATVTVGQGLATQTLQVAGDVRDTVKVWVRAPDGSLVRDAEIVCGCRGPEGRGEYTLDAEAQSDGSYVAANYERGAPYPGSSSSSGGSGAGDKRTYFVRAKTARHGAADTTYDPAADREVTIQLVEPARLRVMIAGFAQSPIRSRIMLTLRSRPEDFGGNHVSEEGKIDAAGTAAFPAVRPGAYDLVLTLARDDKPSARSRWSGTEVLRVPATLPSGENTLSVGVPTVTDLVVTFDAGLPVKSIQLQRVTDDGAVSRIADASPDDAAHEVVFRDVKLVAGRHRLVDRTVGDMWIDLPGPDRIAFKPRAFNALQVRMDGGRTGYLSEIGLQPGDVVVAVDGTECLNTPQIDALLAVARTHESVKLTVLRGGRRIDVAGDPNRLDDGGRLAPWVR